MRRFLALAAATLAPPAAAQFGPVTLLYPAPATTFAELIDVDGDGVRDLVTIEFLPATAQLDVRWSKGASGAPFGPSQPVRTVAGQLFGLTSESRTVDAGDLNGDGFMDLVIATSNGLIQINGAAGNQFPSQTTIDPAPCSDVLVIDLDQDGDLDVARGVFNGVGTPVEIFFLNGGAGSFTPVALPGSSGFCDQPQLTDADQDGDLDVLLVTGSDARLRYFENLGGFSFAGGTLVSSLPSLGPLTALGDVDQDGDDDLLYASFGGGSGGWLENVNGTFSNNHVVAGTTFSISAPRAADMDGDGDRDFVFVQDVWGSSWYPNDGTNQFPQAVTIDLPIVNASVAGLVDVNGDQALDILFSSDNPRGIAAYENLGDLGADTCVANVNSSGVPAELRASGTRSAGTNQFALTLKSAPAGQFAAFLVGRVGQISVLPGSAGILCLGGFGIFRGPGQIAQIDPGGSLLMPIDLAGIPAGAGFVSVQSGETWLFQSIFRDSTALGVSNLSPAVAVTFVP